MVALRQPARRTPREGLSSRLATLRLEMRTYMRSLTPMMEVAPQARENLINGLSTITRDAVGAGIVLLQAGQVGSASLKTLRQVREASRTIEPPYSMSRAHAQFECWLDQLIAGAQLLVAASAQMDVQKLSTASEQILTASQHARRFNALLRELHRRQRADAAA